jgi:hypothetical protein
VVPSLIVTVFNPGFAGTAIAAVHATTIAKVNKKNFFIDKGN